MFRFMHLIPALSIAAMSWPVHADPVGVVEFYNSALHHYFHTIDAAEAAAIDSGAAGPGWSRTGYVFKAWESIEDAPPGAKEVCRFYGTPGKGPSSYFYTLAGAECDQVKRDAGWTLEPGKKFYLIEPVAGACAVGNVPVYRVYNQRFLFNDSNHRYTTQTAVYQAMGWSQEGLVFCSPV